MLSTPTPEENVAQYRKIEKTIVDFSNELEIYLRLNLEITRTEGSVRTQNNEIHELEAVVKEMREKETFSLWWPTEALDEKQYTLSAKQQILDATIEKLDNQKNAFAHSKSKLISWFITLMKRCDLQKSDWLLQEGNIAKLNTIFEKNSELLNPCGKQLHELINPAKQHIERQQKIAADKIAAEAERKKQEAEAQAIKEQLEHDRILATRLEEEKAEERKKEERAAHREEILKPITSIDIDAQYNEKWDPSQSLKKKIKKHAFFQHKDRKSQKEQVQSFILNSSKKIIALLKSDCDDNHLYNELFTIYKDLSISLGSSNKTGHDFVSIQLSRNSQLGKVIKGIRKELVQHRAERLNKLMAVNKKSLPLVKDYSDKKEILMGLANILNTDTISDYTEENQHQKNIFEKMLGFKPFTNGKRSEQLTRLNIAKEEALSKIISLLNEDHINESDFTSSVDDIFKTLMNKNLELLADISEPHQKSRLAVLVAGLQEKIHAQDTKYFGKSRQAELFLTNAPAMNHEHKHTKKYKPINNLTKDVEPIRTIKKRK